MSPEKRYPLFQKENVPAYLTIGMVWMFISLSIGWLLTTLLPLAFSHAFLVVAMTVMLGMAIMFVASVFNLRKLGPGFRRLARGERDPQIPPVWCPVLTAATRAAVELSEKKVV
ncbi:MAG: hypothetical protein AB7V18_09000 [Pyrinomonadaceae bacterium]